MKSTVTRYTFNPCRDDSGLYESADGEYVDYRDYAVLAEKHARALALLADALTLIEQVSVHYRRECGFSGAHNFPSYECKGHEFDANAARTILGLPLVAPAPPPS